MKICFFRHSLFSRGGDKMVAEYANYLSSQGLKVTMLSNIVNTVFPVNVRIEPISRIKNKAGTILSAIFRERDYDLIVADIIIMALLLSFRNRKKILYFAQDYDESYYKYGIMKLFIRSAYYLGLRILKIPVIAVSVELGRLLEDRFSANVTVINNGVDPGIFFHEKKEELLKQKGNGKVILVFARSDHRKGFDRVKRILSGFENEIEQGKISIWAVGEDIRVPFKMRNFGFVSSEELRWILSSSDALLYPSRHEGLPLFVLEAMACGCPVVTTSAVHFISDGVNGMVADDTEELAMKISEILSNESLSFSIAKNAVELVKSKYSIEHSKEEFFRVIRSISGK
ncbi:MAG: glycosyltransferase family 4 protein [Nitrospirota bacterium]|nr:MAG: glycosyltransferase family 4 protein [Nitrospirota bacterium]